MQTSNAADGGRDPSITGWLLPLASVALMLSALAVSAQEPPEQLIQRTIDAAFVVAQVQDAAGNVDATM